MPRLGLRYVVDSDVTFAAVLLPIAALEHLQLGDVNRPKAANMLLGSLPGVYLGSILCGLLPDTWLRAAIVGVPVFAGSGLV